MILNLEYKAQYNIPTFVVAQMDLAAKDNLDWKVDKINNEWVAVFRKVAPED